MMVVMMAVSMAPVAVMVMVAANFDLNLGHIHPFAGRLARPCGVVGNELREGIRNRRK